MRQSKGISRHKITPFNIRNGARAPYFILEAGNGVKKDEAAKLAGEEFKLRSSLSKYPNWNLEVEKI